MLSLRTDFGDGGDIEVETNADQSYYAIIYKARILLRSLAARREGGTYGYCSTLFYASLIEIHSVIVPAYLVFLAPAIVMFGYDNALHHVAKFFIIMQVIQAFNENGLYFLLFALCLDADSIPETTRFVVGRRAKTETYSAKYIYTWVLLLGMWLLVVALKFYFTMLFLWLIPLLVLIYGTALHAYPYLFAGVAACPPHSGPAVEMAGICTPAPVDAELHAPVCVPTGARGTTRPIRLHCTVFTL